MVTVVLGLVFYLGLNFMITPPPTSYNTMFGWYCRFIIL
ncbi:phosphatidylinositol N-acetylglucosaminyltransferase subunit P-like isoform X1 [Iris pallida]|uniref:Phosphatidylinositol N-acetylglucosaminyltransferase subunit P-like isoform X1 n=1 Tax=Iris pallida TaxID=29817 RepID=A0AAX6HR25_IRIPA|nr:phosphatidylinositol N-acetylglucosaminyltransferase subunit P-like isoform X1 [Iris pallida]